MPSPKKRKIRKAVGNIHPAGVLTDAQKTDTFVEVLLSENGHNYASKNALYSNGETVALRTEDSDDGLLTAGEQDATTATPAFATIVCHASIADGQEIGITGSDGTAKLYTAEDDGETLGSRLFASAGNAEATATSLQACIMHSAGHNGAIKVLRDTATLTLYQNVEGAAGNTPIQHNLHSDATVSTTFIGGTNAINTIQGGIPHYWFDTTNSAANVVAAGVEGLALTSSSGIIYDPSGPKSKYISGCETVSSGSAKFVVIRPTSWDANDIINIEIVGDTNTADKLSLAKVAANGSAGAAINAVGDYDLDGDEEAAAFTNITGTINHNAQISFGESPGGFSVKWERDATGLTEADIKKGWYIRWTATSV